jgi:hypothetical protein
MGLVFLFVLARCQSNKTTEKIFIASEGTNLKSLVIPRSLLKSLSESSIRESLRIYLTGNTTPVLGELSINEEEVIFEPIIAFTRGLEYEVRLKGKLLDRISVRSSGNETPTQVLAIYPSSSVLPENLLKMYIHFSQPMESGVALSNIVLLKNGTDTIRNIFLDLNQELWNPEGNRLTLWLDPGRIKKGLVPNEKMGPPLKMMDRFRMTISANWRDRNGNKLIQSFTKEFVVGGRDSTSPDPDKWHMTVPNAGGMKPLLLGFSEPLDYFLVKNTISVLDSEAKEVKGTVLPDNEENHASFIPIQAWKKGEYFLVVECRLEDLAGNNLIRLFDTDLTKKSPGDSSLVKMVPFLVR